MTTGNHKKIKLQPKHRELSHGYITVPWLSMSGIWLEEIGFNVGDTVNIIIRDRLLIIEPAEIPEDQEIYKSVLREVKQTLKKLPK